MKSCPVPPRNHLVLYWVLSVFVLTGFTGCGTNVYETEMSKQLAKLRRLAPFEQLYPGPVTISQTNMEIRLPSRFDTVYAPNDAIGPARLNPPFLQPFPGLSACYETYIKEANTLKGVPIYLYVGAKALEEADRAAYENEVLTRLKTIYPDAAWQPVDAKGPDETHVNWKKISVRSPQPFVIQIGSASETQNLAGTFELWVHQGPGGDVFLGWRWPDELAATIPLDKLAELTAGTLVVKQEAAQANPPQ